MKKIMFCKLLGGLLILSGVLGCNDDHLETPEETKEEAVDETGNEDGQGTGSVSKEILATNTWIKENMEFYYLWNDQLPDTTVVNYRTETDPEAYFYKLLYIGDSWSWITDDYASLAEEYGLTSQNMKKGLAATMGYDPTFYTFSDGKSVFMLVNYVYPGSAAEKAGLKRGNIILSINNTDLDTTNYYELYSASSYSVQLGKITVSNSSLYILDANKSLNLTAVSGSYDPAVYHSVIDTLGYKIGYLAYTEFVAGTNDAYLNSLDAVFSEFKSAGISDLIVDLRYNPGGLIDAAAYLASEIAPATTIASPQKILVNLTYNAEYQAELEKYYPEELYYKFVSVASNLNLSKVYFLSTWATASASELLITGLEPYMNVIQIGESTYGKYVGSYILADDNEEWAMLPIVMKYANANGYTDFKDGLTPDYQVYDDIVYDDSSINNDLVYYYPLGSTSDAMTKTAIRLISGTYSTSVATRSRSLVTSKFSRFVPEDKASSLKRNLFVPVKSELKTIFEKQ